MSTMIVSKADIIESKQPHALDLGNVCSPRFNNGGARAETLRMSDNNLPQNLAYKKDVCLQHLDDALTLRILESRKDCSVCSRSGARRDLFPVSGNKFALANLHKMISPSSVYRESASPSGVPDALTPSNALGSKKSAVCSRSGASRDLFPVSGNKFALANLHKCMKDNYAL